MNPTLIFNGYGLPSYCCSALTPPARQCGKGIFLCMGLKQTPSDGDV